MTLASVLLIAVVCAAVPVAQIRGGQARLHGLVGTYLPTPHLSHWRIHASFEGDGVTELPANSGGIIETAEWIWGRYDSDHYLPPGITDLACIENFPFDQSTPPGDTDNGSATAQLFTKGFTQKMWGEYWAKQHMDRSPAVVFTLVWCPQDDDLVAHPFHGRPHAGLHRG